MDKSNIKAENKKSKSWRGQAGFTLMEVLVALGVLAIALGAIIQSVTATVGNTAYLRDRTFAHWVAMNKVAEIQSLNQFPGTGKSNGTMEMANHEWHWSVNVVDSGVEDVRRLEVEVRLEKDSKQALATLIALAGKT
jgi:general secretion pathway protein I